MEKSPTFHSISTLVRETLTSMVWAAKRLRQTMMLLRVWAGTLSRYSSTISLMQLKAMMRAALGHSVSSTIITFFFFSSSFSCPREDPCEDG